MDVDAVFAETSQFDLEHEVTAHWDEACASARLVELARTDFEGLCSVLGLDEQAANDVAHQAEMTVVECRGHVRRSLVLLAGTGPDGPMKANLLRGRLRLRSMFGAEAPQI